MKIRTDFITNSSSAAFIVKIDHLTCKQRTHLNKLNGKNTGWAIIDIYPVMFGSTSIDNFGMKEYLKKIGFPMKRMQFFSSNDRTKSTVYLKSMKTCDCEWCKMLRELSK